jgi:Leucine-rich repeat (LRR) protein
MKTKVTHWLLFFSLFLLSGASLTAQQGIQDREEEDDNPEARLEFEFLRTKNPSTGLIPDNIRAKELAFMREQAARLGVPFAGGDIASDWKNRGPFNVGGRTRALAVDSRNENIILAGGVSGGMWRSADQGATWQKTTGSNELQSVSCIAQDLTDPDTWYYGTGEFSGNSASGSGAFFLGDGIYKSTDNGQTWSVLPATVSDTPQSFDQSFDINMEMAVDPTNGDVYVATVGAIHRSTDGGASFTTVLTANSQWADIVVSATGVLYAVLDAEGVFTSTDGTNWTDITPASGFPLLSGERKELALAPSNENILYLLGEDSDNSSDHSLWHLNAGTGVWTDRSANVPQFGGLTGDFDSQGGYDLLIKVKPDDENFVIIGGTNLFRSTDGFSSTANTTWIGGYTAVNTTFNLYPDHHPDQHSFVFLSGTNALSGNDGGIQITSDIGSNLSPNEAVDWVSLNNGYVTTQVYALSAGPGDQIMAGFQDNSTWLTTSTASDATWTDQFGGDGAYNAFNADGTVRYMSSQRGNIFRVNYDQGADDTGADGFTDFAPNGYSASLFIVPFYLDPVDDDLFYLAGASELYVNTQASTGSASTGWKVIDLGTTGVLSEIGVSPSNVVFAGTTNGELFKITDPGGNESVTEITGSNFPSGYISAVAVNPVDENAILVTFSNYGIPSVFYTSDGGTTWDDVSGNLEENTDGTGSGPSVRSATILGNGDRYFVGTSTGLYSTGSLSGASVVWTQENASGIGEVVVEHLISRMADGLVLAGTHGNGVYSANFELTPPVENDLGIAAITAPEEELLSSNSQAVTISAVVRNYGAQSQSSFDITYLVDGELIATETISQTINAGEDAILSFTTPFDFSTAGTYSLKVGVALTGDEDDTNDTRTITVTSISPINTFPYQENFDASSELPDQWFADTGDYSWLINSGGTPSGETGPLGDNTSGEGNYVYAEATGANFEDEAFLASPWISITGMDRPTLEFYYHMFGFEMGSLEVLIFDSDEELTSLQLIEGPRQEGQDDAFIQEVIDLADFDGKTIRILFRAIRGVGFRSDVAVDDIKVFSFPLNDLALTAITAPEEQVSGTEPVIVEITNLGLEAQSGFEISYSVNGSLVTTETVSGTLEPGASVVYPFTELFDFSERGDYEIIATVTHAGDENPDNDDREKAVYNLPFTGYYVMEQDEATTSGPSFQFGNGFLFDNGGFSKVLISAEAESQRSFDIRYFNYQDFTNSASTFTFDLTAGGETELTEEVVTGLSCGTGGAIFLGPGSANGTYDETDDNQFSLIIREDINLGCNVGSPEVSFTLTKLPSVNEADSLALIALYNSTDGANWDEPWDLTQTAFFWEGVIISSQGRVLGIVLDDNNLNGTIPSEIGDLSALIGLVLSDNELEGEIPAEIGNLSSLEALTLQGNELSGAIPPEISGLASLEEMNLAGNDLNGAIPAGLGELTLLRDLSLLSNNLSGEVPAALGGLINLERLDLGENDLEGDLPEELADLTSLEFLQLRDNDFTGAIPEGFAQLDGLSQLLIQDNNFSGLPDLTDLDFDFFAVDFNNLDFGDLLPNIGVLDAYIPQADIGEPLTLVGIANQDLSLETNTFDDGNNKYQWFLNDVAINGATAATLLLNYGGPGDEGLYRCDVTNDGVPGLTLSRFINVIDEAVTAQPDYAALVAFYNATGGPNWIDKTNWLTSAPLDTWFGLSTDIEGRVNEITLDANNLRGILPENLGDLDKLESLSLRFNYLEGELPASLWQITSLDGLYLDANQLEGEISPDIQNLSNLIELMLNNNGFSGEFPAEISSLTGLRLLWAYDNNFSGSIPESLGNLSEVRLLDMSFNDFTGEIPSTFGGLSSVREIHFHNNNLSGSIPSELGDLADLRILTLFNNELTGEVPSSFTGLTQLNSLEIFNNQLVGLPDLSSLTNISRFTIHKNRFNFEDIVPNIANLSFYTPQADVDDEIEAIVNQGTEYIMEVSDNATGNEYQWYRNGQPVNGATSRTYTIADFQVVHEGEYTCQITNPAAPDLTLFRNPITLEINYSPSAISLDNSSIAENEVSGTLVGTFSVEDIDLEDEYIWALAGTDAASFSLNGNQLLTNEVFDFETKNSFEIVVSVQDQGGLTAQTDLTIEVTNVNEAPVLAVPLDDQTTDEDAAFELTLPESMFTDEDGDAVTIAFSGLPATLTFDETTQKVTGTPLQGDVGVHTVTVTATDPSDATANDSFELTITNVNDAPMVATEQADMSTDEDALFEYTIPDGTFSDEDMDDLTLTVSGLPASLVFDESTNTISGTPLQADVASYTIQVTATDPSGEAVTDSFELTVINVNDAPVIGTAQADQSADEDALFEYQIPAGTFTDEDQDALTITVSGMPATLSLDTSTGTITGTPLQADIGVYTITVTATDPGMLSVTDEFELTVNAVNDAPELVTALPDVQTDRDALFELSIDPANVTDEEGDPITIAASGLPASLTMTGGTISGTPVLGENGDFQVTITYSDGNGGSVEDSFVLTVNLVTSLEEEREFGRIAVQPNPFTNEIRLTVEKGLFGKTDFLLRPIGGKSVWNSSQNLSGETELTLQVNKPVAQGVYLLIVIPEGKSPIVRKVIKKE